ncbi:MULTISPECIES: hypothetical protein [Micrococcus]|nr:MULTISPECIES: hypothetical protein [Micrococcus]MCM3481419.1 hypothetical protein [Micrococcus luteus]MCV7449642.1 hypothetical protein [Micrococcus luteus]MCV7597895.1 hypothetical protein [Micrococcus luteus]MCV7640984.1 hypothetical protein [Micrococcus luteus]
MSVDELTINEAPEQRRTEELREQRAERGRGERVGALTLSKRDVRRMARTEKRARQDAAKAERAARRSTGGILQRWADARRENTARPGPRGWNRAGGAPAGMLEDLFEVQGSAVQLCGFFPFTAGAGLPVVGVPLGYHTRRRSTVCADPVSWFTAGIISNPSAFVLGQPGLGKSSLVHRIITVLSNWGTIPLVLADSRPDYVHTIRALGGQVIAFAPGKGHVNPLDLGPVVAQLHQIADPVARKEALDEMASRRLAQLKSMIGMILGRPLAPHEASVLAQAVHMLDPELRTAPVITDLTELIRSRPEGLRNVALTYDDPAAFDARVQGLLDALVSLGPSGPYGTLFSEPTSEHLQPGRPAVFDISGANKNDGVLMAAIQSLCWNLGSATVSAESHLSRAAGRRRRTYILVMDELWQVLRASGEMVHFVDTITRLNRGMGIGQVMVTHTMKDLKLPEQHLTDVAWGFVERSAMVFLGGLAEGEMGNLEEAFALTDAEVAQLSDWIGEAPVDPWTGKAGLRPGAGNFLLKTGKEAGIPFHTQLTRAEKPHTETNRDWDMTNHDVV